MSERAQTIFRVVKNPDNPFVMIDRRAVENPKLSWRAKGLLAYLLSRPDDWVVRFKDLAKRSPDGAHTVREAMKELKAAGHVDVTTEREGGRITKWTYNIHEAPHGGFQQVEKQEVENRTFNNKDKGSKKKKANNIAATPKAPKPKKEPKPKANAYPELVTFREVVKRYPSEANWQEVIDDFLKINLRLGHDATREDLLPFYQAWTRKGYNPWGLGWLDWAVRGETPQNAKIADQWSKKPTSNVLTSIFEQAFAEAANS